MPTMTEFLNTPAFTGGPTISQMFLEVHNVYTAMFIGGPAMEDAGRPIQRSLAAIAEAVGPIRRGEEYVPLRQEVADTKTVALRVEDLLAPILRDGDTVSVRQEIADTKTIAIRIESKLDTGAA